MSLVCKTWGNFTNTSDYEEAKELCQQGFDKIRVTIVWKEQNSLKVDYDLLKNFVAWISTDFKQTFPTLSKEIDNMSSFFANNEEYQSKIK